MESSVGTDVKIVAGCSKRLDFSPAQPWRAETCHEPGRGSSDFPHFALRGTARLSFPVRIGRALFYGARSASKKAVWLLPFLHSEAASCASKGIVPATSPPFFSILVRTGPLPLLFLRLSQHRLKDRISVQHRFQRFCPDEEVPDVRRLPRNFSKPSFGFRESLQ